MKNSFDKIIKIVTAIGMTIFLTASTASSQQVSATAAANNFKTFIDSLTEGVVASMGYLFMGTAVVAFIFGIATFLLAARSGNDKKLTEGKQFMLWGVIALFVMFSTFGLVRFLQSTLGITDNQSIVIPTVRVGGGGAQTGQGGSVMGVQTGQGGSVMGVQTGQGGSVMGVQAGQGGGGMGNQTVVQIANRPLSSPCTINSQCASGYCYSTNRNIPTVCQASPPSSQVQTETSTTLPNGSSCTSPSQCISGYCQTGRGGSGTCWIDPMDGTISNTVLDNSLRGGN